MDGNITCPDVVSAYFHKIFTQIFMIYDGESHRMISVTCGTVLLLGRASPGRRRSCGSVSWRASTRRCSERTPFCRRRRDRWTPRGTAGWGRDPTDACLTAPHRTFWRILFFPIFILNLYQISPMFKSSWIELQGLLRISFPTLKRSQQHCSKHGRKSLPQKIPFQISSWIEIQTKPI